MITKAMPTLSQAAQTYRDAAENLNLRAQILETVAGDLPADLVLRHMSEAASMVRFTEQWDGENFASDPGSILETMADHIAVETR